MKVVCVMVQSVNGKTTRGGDPRIFRWTSPEDQRHFAAMVANATLIVMGRETYEAAKKAIRPEPGKVRIVLTSTPKKYAKAAIPGQLEFRKDTPNSLVQEFDGEHETLLLAGGGKVNAQFFDAGLVDELYITLEPVMFSSTNELVFGLKDQVRLKLISSARMNDRGTMLLHYRVLRHCAADEAGIA